MHRVVNDAQCRVKAVALPQIVDNGEEFSRCDDIGHWLLLVCIDSYLDGPHDAVIDNAFRE